MKKFELIKNILKPAIDKLAEGAKDFLRKIGDLQRVCEEYDKSKDYQDFLKLIEATENESTLSYLNFQNPSDEGWTGQFGGAEDSPMSDSPMGDSPSTYSPPFTQG